MPKNVNVIVSAEALTANSPSKAGPVYLPPAIHHRGISFEQLKGLTGCVRRANPNPFPGSFGIWVGKQVRFVLEGTSFEVTRTIKSIGFTPIEAVSPDDLKGTLAEIAMRELNLPFREFFRQVYGDQTAAMVIRVRPA
jgi:hypothetical protein